MNETDWPRIECGDPDNPEIAVYLPRSIWQAVQTLLALTSEVYPHGSDEHRNIMATIGLIKARTGLEPNWSEVP